MLNLDIRRPLRDPRHGVRSTSHVSPTSRPPSLISRPDSVDPPGCSDRHVVGRRGRLLRKLDRTEVTARAARDLGVARYVSTSTQYVHATDRAPLGDDDFSPFTAYGESKVRSEAVTRSALDGSSTAYVIIRPTNIWALGIRGTRPSSGGSCVAACTSIPLFDLRCVARTDTSAQ